MARLYSGETTVDDWHPLNGSPAPDHVPSVWSGPHVQKRLADAWRVLSKMPWRSPFPRAFGQTWPKYRLEWFDLLAIVGGGELDSMYRQANKVRVLPSARDISRMEIALDWPAVYLQAPRAVLIVHTCARVLSFDGDLAREMRKRRYPGVAEQWQKLNWALCNKIADGLIGERVAVF